MSDPAKEPDIEDVLASVRRLVSASRRERPATPSALVLTPSQRVERPSVSPLQAPADAPAPTDAPDSEAREDSDVSRALAGSDLADAHWEDDEPQDAFAAWSRGAQGAERAEGLSAVPTLGEPAPEAAMAQDDAAPGEAAGQDAAGDVHEDDGDAPSGEIEAWDIEPDPASVGMGPGEGETGARDAPEAPGGPAEAGGAEPSIEEVLDAVAAGPERAGPARARPSETVAFHHDPAPEIPASGGSGGGGARPPLFAVDREPARASAADDEAEALRDEGYVDFDEVEIGGVTDVDPDMVEDAEIIGEEGPEHDVLDEEALRAMVSDIVREELRGRLGERITANVRKLVRREIHRILAARDFE